jgi:protein-tyrosine-phosphatase
MRAYGLDLGSHRARCVSAELLAQYDLILTMEAGQAEALRIEFPGAAPRVRLFSAAAGSEGDVADPIGQPPEVYPALAAEIEALIEQGFDRLCQLALTFGSSAV